MGRPELLGSAADSRSIRRAVAEKTAYGFVMKYFEEKSAKNALEGKPPIVKRKCEIERIAEG